MKDKIEITSASHAQLIEFATSAYGLDVTKNTPVKRIIEKLREAGFDEDLIEATSEAPVLAATAAGKRATKADLDEIERAKGDVMVEVRIMTGPGKGGNRAVPLGCNGIVMLVPRDGKPYKIPMRFYESLRNAIELDYEPIMDERTGNAAGISEAREVQSYPHSALL